MDLLPLAMEALAGGGAGAGQGLRRGVGFRLLKLVTVAMDEPLPAEPVGVAYGRLANGLTYYVCSNPKPRMRAALSLAVKVGGGGGRARGGAHRRAPRLQRHVALHQPRHRQVPREHRGGVRRLLERAHLL